MRFYYSTRLGEAFPGYGVYAKRVRELLDQYVVAAHGKIRLEVYNPLPFSDVEDRAVAFGLQGVPLNQQGEQVYFGLAGTNSTDDQQVIPFFSPDRERFLEYDLTRLVHTLAFPKRTVVGLDQHLPLEGDMAAIMQGRPSGPMAVLQQLRQLDDVEALPPEPRCDPRRHRRADAGASAEPAEKDIVRDRPVRAERRQGAGLCRSRIPSCRRAAEPANPPAPTGSNLEPLFKAWGFRTAARCRRRRPPRCAAGRRAGAGARRGADRLRRLAQSASAESEP